MVVKQFQDSGRTAILKIDISPYLSEKSSDFHDVIKNEKVAFDRLRV